MEKQKNNTWMFLSCIVSPLQKKSILLFFFVFFLIESRAQPECKAASILPPPAAVSTTNCVQLLNDFAPLSSYDPTLHAYVNVYVLVPTFMSSVSSVWTNSAAPSTSLDAITMLNGANQAMMNIPAVPQLTTAANTHTLTDTKIRFVLNKFEYIYNDTGYVDVSSLAIGWLGWNYHDRNAINVFFGTQSSRVAIPGTTLTAAQYYGGSNGMGGLDAITNLKGIYINPENHFTVTPTCTYNCRYDNISKYGNVFAHEAGHILGLNHTTGLPSTNSNVACCAAHADSSFISPKFGCCNFQKCTDYVVEHYNCVLGPNLPGGCGIQYGKGGCDTVGASDNFMSQNGGCNRYLSPQQIGVIHYNLRTTLKDFLTSPGLSAATNVNTAFDYDVTTNETWTEDRYIKGNITVKANKNLTISCGVAMTHGAKIIVERGGLLTVDGGTITNISGRTWDGIHLMGKPGDPQLSDNPSNTAGVLHQGMLRIKNGGTISQAAVGVRNYHFNVSNSGGVIFAQNANFINNVIDVQMIGLEPVGTTQIPSASWFSYCNFKTTDTIANNLAPKHHVRALQGFGA